MPTGYSLEPFAVNVKEIADDEIGIHQLKVVKTFPSTTNYIAKEICKVISHAFVVVVLAVGSVGGGGGGGGSNNNAVKTLAGTFFYRFEIRSNDKFK
ncbi:hypothetical protein M0804_004099 [Polistes exclamans]|nr:hypothetical protein M0804_004099 [Polistes exclamans]